MTSKNSFLNNMHENLKRRNWIMVISCLYFFFAYPIVTALGIRSCQMNYRASTLDAGMMTAQYIANMQRDIESIFQVIVSVNPFGVIAFGILAFLCATQGFGYLHKQTKVDMYHALPVSKSRRFFAIFLNGIVIFLIPYFVGIFLSLGIYLIMAGPLPVGILGTIGSAFLKNLLFYLCIYCGSILAVMLTGSNVLSFFMAVLIFFYHNLTTLLYYGMAQTFFETASFRNVSDSVILGVFKPITTFIQNMMDASINNYLMMTVFLLISFALSFWLYLKRAGEASGKAIAFPAFRIILKLLITLPVTLSCGMLFYLLTGESILFTILGLLIGLFLCHGVLEVIFEFDLRSALKHRSHLALCGILSAVIFMVFQFDVFGYDSYLPKTEQLKSVGIQFDQGNHDFYKINSFSGNLERHSLYPLYQMELTEFDAVLSLAQNHTKDWEHIATPFSFELIYRLENGKTVSRHLTVDATKNMDALNQIFASPGYKEASLQLFDDEFFKTLPPIDEVSYSYSRNYQGTMMIQQDKLSASELKALVLEDYSAMTFTEYVSEIPYGFLSFYVSVASNNNQNYYGTYSWEVPVYPSFSRTLKALENAGIETSFKLNPENISSIQVYYDQNSITLTAENDAAQIESLCEFIVPDPYTWFYPEASSLNRYFNIEIITKGNPYPYGDYIFTTSAILPDNILALAEEPVVMVD